MPPTAQQASPTTYVDAVLKTKMLESETLQAQATSNTKEQFANSPNLPDELMKAIMDAMQAHQTMSRQVLNSELIQARILSTLLGPGKTSSRARRWPSGWREGCRRRTSSTRWPTCSSPVPHQRISARTKDRSSWPRR